MFAVFVAVTLIGMTLHESIRKAEARSLGYESHYGRGWDNYFSGVKRCNQILTLSGKPTGKRSGQKVILKIKTDGTHWYPWIRKTTH